MHRHFFFANDYQTRVRSRFFRVAIAVLGAVGVCLSATRATPPASTGVFGWGANDVGQLGHGTTSAYLVPATAELYGKTIVALASGDSHSMALDSNGVIHSWGSNSHGQLGNNSTTSSSVPVVVNTASGVSALHGKTVIAIAAGIKYSVALASDGTVATWGADEGWGKLGNGSSASRSVPTAVVTSGALAGKTIIAISAGQDHCLALGSDGIVYGWGNANHGRLAPSVGTYSSTPIAVTATGVMAGKTVTAITAGGAHSLARVSDGTIYGWGLNYNGQLGSGSTSMQIVTPEAVNVSGALAGKTITALAAGREHTLALASDGTVYAWGMGEGGRLGNNLGTDSLVPVAVTMSGVLSGKTVIAISSGVAQSLALTSDGMVYTWGKNSHPYPGAVGDGTSIDRLVPVAVSTISGTSALAGAAVLRLATSVVSPFSLVAATSSLTVPDAPVIVAANALDSQVTVTFNAPANTGGATITSYSVTASPGGSIVTGTASPLVVTGLTNGVPYTFTITATNAVGTSVASTPTAPVSPPVPYSFTTLAGAGTVGSTNATGTAAQFNFPRGVAVDGAGTIYIGDTSGHTIRRISSTGVVTTLAGSGVAGSADATGTAATFNSPVGVTVSTDGTVYVADSANHRIRKITSAGVVTTLAGSGNPGSSDATGTAASFNTPTGVAVDSAGNVYVADSLNHKIRKVTSGGVVTTYAGVGFASSWDGMSALGAYFNTPTGVALDAAGNVFVADAGNHAIRKITPVNTVITLAGSAWTTGSTDATGSSASFYYPVGVAVDSAGNLYVADQNNHKIRKVTGAGAVSTLAGSISGSADGTGSAARFNRPAGIAVDGAGVLFVTDYNNQTIRRGTLFGASVLTSSTTAAGSVGASFSYQIGFSNSATNFTATGLPAGLSVNSNTGIISGIPTSAGPSSVTLGAANASGVLSLTIGLGTQSIEFGILSDKTYGDAAFTVSATPSSALPPTYSIVSGPATIAGDLVTLTGAGNVVVRASQAGNGSYNAAVPVDQSFTVAKRILTITASSHARAYGTANPAFSLNYSGFAPGDSATVLSSTPIATTAATNSSGPGIYPITVTGGAAGNYSINPVNGTLTITAIAQTIPFPPSGDLVVSPRKQTIAFAALPNHFADDGPFGVSGTATSGLPVSFRVIAGPATMSAGTVTLKGGTGTVTIRATQSGNDHFAAAAPVDRLFVVTESPTGKSAPVISQQPANQSVTAGESAMFSVTAAGNPAPTYQWRRGGVALAGETGSSLNLRDVAMADSGSMFDVIAGNSAGEVTSSSATLTVLPAAREQFFFGQLGTDGHFALHLRSGGEAVLMGELPGARGGFVVKFKMDATGGFRVTTSVPGILRNAAQDGVPARAMSAAEPLTVVLGGVVANGQLVGQIEGTGDVFKGVAQTAGATSGVAGFYEAPIVNGGQGVTYLLVGTDGTAMGATSSGSATEVAMGSVSPAGLFSVRMDPATMLEGSIDGGGLTGRVLANGSPPAIVAGVSANVKRTDRLMNLSTRGIAGSDEKTIIAGFVISGTQPKKVLVRAVGPALAALGVNDSMEDPVLTIFRGDRVLLSNDNWSSAADPVLMAAEAIRLGAFPLAAGGKDAALFATLEPGVYTAQITNAPGSANGVAVIELYDAGSNAGEADRLINISSRGEVRPGEGLLICGFVVTGNFPKTILIRGIGPSLAQLGIGGALANPMLRLFRGDSVIAANDDWMADNAPAIDAAAMEVGAFTLNAASKDAVILVTLAPGAYTAQISGRDETSGIALLEVYDVP